MCVGRQSVSLLFLAVNLCTFTIFLSPFVEYPDPPCDVEVTETDRSLLVSWQHNPSLPESNAATSFVVYMNGERCSELLASVSPSASSHCVEIFHKDIKQLDQDITLDSSVQLTVRAQAGLHESRDSHSILLSHRQLSLMLSQHSQMLGSEESSSSEVSVSSSEEEKTNYSPSKVENDKGDVTARDDHMTTRVTNGVQEDSRGN